MTENITPVSMGLTSDNIGGHKDCIANNLPPRAMRYTMENKNNLTKKGSMYVGLGEKRETDINVGTLSDSEIHTYESYKTGVIDPPAGNGNFILMCSVVNNVAKMAWVNIGSIKCVLDDKDIDPEDDDAPLPGDIKLVDGFTFADGIKDVSN